MPQISHGLHLSRNEGQLTNVIKLKASVYFTINQMKKKQQNGGRIFDNYVFDRQLIYRIYKEFKKQREKKTNGTYLKTTDRGELEIVKK